MPRMVIPALLGSLILLLLPVDMRAADSDLWRTDYELALLEARQSGKPLFVVFRCER